MPRGSFAPFLSFIRARRRANDADADLLARFTIDRDEDAFAELVRRHGPLVWGVARQILGHDQDAEDAFQATFLLLSRNAARIRTAAAVAGWLHGTAWRVATKAKLQAVARHKREQFIATKTNGDVVADVSLRELQAILHTEIAALPAKYRTPFVLCVLEGRSRAEVAKSLAWNEGTLSTRLAWARQRLRSRLIRRGVDVSAALTAIEISHDANAALPATLVHSSLAAVRTGVVSAGVATLVHGGLMTSKLAPLAALGLVLSIIAVGTAGLMGSDPPAQPPAKEVPAPRPAAERPGRLTGTCLLNVTGTATGPNDKPIAGATIFLRLTAGREKPFATAKTDAQGHYEFKDLSAPMSAAIRVGRAPNPEPVPNLIFQISGIADGLAVQWTDEFALLAKAEAGGTAKEPRYNAGAVTADLKFSPAEHFQGRIVDDNGKPVVGAKVQMTRCDHLMATAAPQGPGLLRGALGADCLPEAFTTAKTDSDGRFRINGVPADAIALFAISHPDYTAASVIAALAEPHPAPRGSRNSTLYLRSVGGSAGKIIVGVIDVTLKSPRTVVVAVVSSTTGKPIVGARVSIGPVNVARNRGIGSDAPEGAPTSNANGTTDAEGKTTLRLPPGKFTVRTNARAAGRESAPNPTYYCQQETNVEVNDNATQSLTVRLEPACKINLEVVEAGTGKPVVNQRLDVQIEQGLIPGRVRAQPVLPPPPPAVPRAPPLPPPPAKPVIDWRDVEGSGPVIHTTDADGKTMTWANPGKGRIRVRSGSPIQYEVFETTDPVTLEPGGEVKLRVELRKK